ncbi:FUSC family protein [Paroceanicella profunda]|uniref:FUSC family protein n=1 Tax=Paroceanicella profunda TaxID=2579971 RepID=A0A5B8FH13_9RHOB|nr:FUSC family protein [Paroceanicella profunda]QDL91657.1 FUSC family protein [Paroceanicella profunda]
MSLGTRLAAAGFDTPRLGFALRTALGACLALWIAWLLGLEHPQWAGMTVWATSLPTRGQLLEKGLFRVAGTVIGALAGIGLVLISGGSPALLVTGLALWIALCAGLGNLLRSFTAYGVMLAGYTAAMVSLLEAGAPGHIVALGADRMLTVLTGALTALAVGWLFAGRGEEALPVGRLRLLSARLLRAMADGVAGGPGAGQDGAKATPRALLSELAAIEEALDPHSAGSLRARQTARAMRRQLSAHVSALFWLSRQGAGPARPDLAAALEAAAEALDMPGEQAVAAARLTRAQALAAPDAETGEVLSALAAALRDGPAGAEVPAAARASVILHRDWVGAREAALRALGMMLAIGLLWVVTGWSVGPFVLLGTAIMASLFSTFDNPAGMMRFVFIGQLAGAAGALACHWLAWPLAGGPAGQIALAMPFVLFGALVFGHRRTQALGFDYNMVLLLLLQPHWPLSGSFPQSLALSLAVPAAPMLAYFAYRHVFPPSPQRRRDTLIAMMVRELEAMAARPERRARQPVWQARLTHRVLRLASWSDKSPRAGVSPTEGSLAVLALGRAILHLQELAARPGPQRPARRRPEAALRRLAAVGQSPERAARALAAAARHVARHPAGNPALLTQAARALAQNADFFRTAARDGGAHPA